MDTVDEQSIDKLVEWIRATPNPSIEINCTGGDTVSAMKFIKIIKTEGLEEKLSIHVTMAGSAAAHIALSLRCKRTIYQDGLIIIHGGRIAGELNELFLTGLWREMQTYFRETLSLIDKISTRRRKDAFYATNYLTLTKEEVQQAGVEYIEKGHM